MAWLTENTDYIVTSSKSFPHHIVVGTGYGTSVAFVRTTTTTSKYAGGMTKAGADAQAAAYLLAHPTADVQVDRENDGGAYRVVINEETRSAWAEE
ncbi:MAG: hypothetical protein WC455_30875 [Dehalococcoidia bacterium]|jgi:hypothetical protein